MKEERGFFFSYDRLRLYYRVWLRGNGSEYMVICHGHGEHSGRYEKFPRVLDEPGLTIAAFDCRGSGLSEGPEVYVASFDDYLDDLSAFVEFLRTRYGLGPRMILFGHSLGGLVAVHWAFRNPGRVSLMILSSPCLGLNLPPLLRSFNRMMNRWFPRWVYQNPVYPPHLSHNPEEIKSYREDRLIKRKMTVRLLDEMLKYMAKLDSEAHMQFSFPLYILTAGLERVVDGVKTRNFFERVAAPDKDLKVFPGFYHEIFNELGQEQAFDALKESLARGRKFVPN